MAKPIAIRMGGYGPATTGFSRSLKCIGDRLAAEFGERVDIKYVWNIMDLGYQAQDILWLVEDGLLTLGYQSSSYLTDRIPELGVLDLPFLCATTQAARAVIDGNLGQVLAQRIEERTNFRILGFFENGFRHISNRIRPVRLPADLAGLRIRVLPSRVQARTFELFGAVPLRLDLTEAIAAITTGSIDAQENPLSNTVAYGVHKFHRFHTLSNHFYSKAGPKICAPLSSARLKTRSRSSASFTFRRKKRRERPLRPPGARSSNLIPTSTRPSRRP
jgi:TRAP-type transport system periplasmic protein